ncbi:hypothetical protein GGX14DRAFT_347613, partial [Mycena pura]
ISALRKCELRVVQSSLIGSMLSKLLLVLGLCLFAGGIRFSEQGIDPDNVSKNCLSQLSSTYAENPAATQLNSSLLSLGVGVVLLPAAYHFALSGNSDMESQLQMKNILSMSHGVSIILLFIYGSYLFFQLCSHTHLYKDGNKRSMRARLEDFLPSPRSKFSQGELRLSPPRNIYCSPRSSSETTLPIFEPHSKSGGGSRSGLGGVEMSRDDTFSQSLGNESSCSLVEKWQLQFESTLGTVDARQPRLSMVFISLILTVVTVAVAFTADRLVESMDSISSTIPKPYVALIILPAINSLSECMTGVNASAKDELNFAISVAVGSTIQTALFVIPFMVTLAWAMGKPLALLFDPFESLVLYISVQVSTYVMADGKSNYLEGMVLLCTWTIISVSFWFYPGAYLLNSADCSMVEIVVTAANNKFYLGKIGLKL